MSIDVEIFSKLPRDLIVEVVLRLPVKAALRFRCVAKLFYHLITPDGSTFARSYSEVWTLSKRESFRVSNSSNFVVPSLREHFKDKYELEEPEKLGKTILHDLNGALGKSSHGCRFMFRDDREENYTFHLGGCCDGILCMYQWHEGLRLTIYLCNPALNQVRVLCQLGFGIGPGTKVCFVSDPLTHDYKVVVFGHQSRILIYSLKNNAWRNITQDSDHSQYVMMRGYGNTNVVIHNDSPHWLSHRKYQELCVNVLDMTQETIREIPLPAEFSAPRADSLPDPYSSSEPAPLFYDSDQIDSTNTDDYLGYEEYYNYYHGRGEYSAGSIPKRDSTLHLERYKGCLALTYDDLRFRDPVVELWVMQEDMEWVKQVITMDVPRWIYSDDGYRDGVVCRTPWATTTWTYMISNFDADRSTVIFTDPEDEKSAQKCRIGTGRMGLDPRDHAPFYAVADYVSSFVSVMPPAHRRP